MISPLSAKKAPVIALNSVDFPAPLLPTIVAKSPCFKVRFRFFNAHFSLNIFRKSDKIKRILIFHKRGVLY